MTKQEFSERTKLNPSDEEYQVIERMYLAAGDMDKDDFCREYSRGIFPLTMEYYKETKVLNGRLEEAKNIIDDLHEQRSAMMDFLLEQSQSFCSREMRAKALSILGEREYIVRKIRLDLPFWEENKEIIMGLI